MKAYSELVESVKARLGDTHRFKHTLMVVDTAKKLAAMNGADVQKAEIAALLHDVTKHETPEFHKTRMASYFGPNEYRRWPEPIWHALSAVVVAKQEFLIDDTDILNAIHYHTSGRPAMSLLEKIIFVADFIEPTRPFDNHLYYDLAMKNLDKSVAVILKSLHDYLIAKGETPVSEGVEALRYYQYLLEEENGRTT